MKEILLKRDLVYKKETEDLIYDIDTFNQFLSDDEKKLESCGTELFIEIDKYTDSDSDDISILKFKKLINEAEKAGANYIQIEWHQDHQTYIIYGSKIQRPNKNITQEIKETKKKKMISKIDNNIKYLEDQIKQLKKHKNDKFN